MLRRVLVLGGAAVFAALAGCAQRSAPSVHVLVVLRPTEQGYDIYVGEERVQVAELHAVVLREAIAKAPNLSAEEVQRSALIAVGTNGVSREDTDEVAAALRGFARIVYIAEDRRR